MNIHFLRQKTIHRKVQKLKTVTTIYKLYKNIHFRDKIIIKISLITKFVFVYNIICNYFRKNDLKIV